MIGAWPTVSLFTLKRLAVDFSGGRNQSLKGWMFPFSYFLCGQIARHAETVRHAASVADTGGLERFRLFFGWLTINQAGKARVPVFGGLQGSLQSAMLYGDGS